MATRGNWGCPPTRGLRCPEPPVQEAEGHGVGFHAPPTGGSPGGQHSQVLPGCGPGSPICLPLPLATAPDAGLALATGPGSHCKQQKWGRGESQLPWVGASVSPLGDHVAEASRVTSPHLHRSSGINPLPPSLHSRAQGHCNSWGQEGTETGPVLQGTDAAGHRPWRACTRHSGSLGPGGSWP